MSLQFKIKVLDALKEKGYSTYILRKEKLLSESTVQKLRAGEGVSWENIETLCQVISGKDDIFYGTNKQVLLSNIWEK